MSIKLLDKNGLGEEFTGSNENLKKDGVNFVTANVSSGTWIFYTYANYNDSQAGGNSSNYKVVQPAGGVDISTVNGSMLLLPDQVEGIVLFKHGFYGGFSKWFEESCPDVNPYFPSGKGAGVSSAIVLSKNENFAIFTETKYKGIEQQLDAGKWYKDPAAMKFPNDRLQSFRKE